LELLRRKIKEKEKEQETAQEKEPSLPPHVLGLLDEMETADCMLALAWSRGDAGWWKEVAQAVEMMRDAPMSRQLLQRVLGVWPECWQVSWQLRDQANYQLLLQLSQVFASEDQLRQRARLFRKQLYQKCRALQKAQCTKDNREEPAVSKVFVFLFFLFSLFFFFLSFNFIGRRMASGFCSGTSAS
jgi:hypothetical protein